MARDVESLILMMSADIRRMEKSLDQGQRKFDRTANAIERRQRELDRNLAKLGQTAGNFARPVQLAATVALGAITAFSYQAAKRAEAVDGAFEQTFRDMPVEAGRAVEAISNEFGRLETDVKDNFTQLRSVVSALGVDSQTALTLVDQLQRRSLDMAAFKDVSDAEAFRAVISGITGETEPLKRFGVVVNETAVKAELLRLGFKGNAQQASEAAKVIARANIILRQSGEMHGQVARESDTLAEQEKRTRAQFVKAAEDLGQKFLPVAGKVLKWASDALDAFNRLPDGVQTAGLALLALVAASGPIGAAITGLRALIAAAVAARVALAAVGGGTAAAAAGGAAAGAGAAGLLAPAAAGAAVLSLRGDTPNGPAQGQERVNQQLRHEAETRERIARLTREGNVAEATRQQQYLARVEANRRAGQAALAQARPADPMAEADAAAAAALAGLGDFGLSDAQRNGTGTGGGSSRRGAVDRTPGLRAQLDLELAIAAARATGDDAAIRAAEEREELARLVSQYEAAGYADAESRATSHLALLNQATALTEEREKVEEQIDIILDGRERQMERDAEYRRLLNDQLMDRLSFEREIASLLGNAGALGDAERRLWIEERTNEILRLRLALTEGEARAMAGVEFGALEAAGQTGEMREAFRRSFSEGLRAAIDGDLGGFFEGLADRFTDRMLDNLADDLFDLVSQAAKGFGGAEGQGGGWISAIASLFSGRARATGGPVTAGQAYVVGERRPEVFVPSTAGSIIPSVNRAMSQAGRASGRQVVEYRLTVSPEKDSFIRLASDAAAPMAVQAAATAYGASRSDMASAQRRGRQRFV